MHDVLTRREGDASVITLNVPERRNALSRSVLKDLQKAIRVEGRSGARALVISGGENCFSAGADLGEVSGSLRDLELDEEVADAAEAIWEAPVPVIAAIEGPCIGAAIELVSACDVRVAGAGAFFELPATRLGLLYRPAAVISLTRAISKDTLARLLLVGERISSHDAYVGGLVGVVTEDGWAEQTALEMISRSARGSRSAVEATKALLVATQRGTVDPADWEDVRRELLTSDERVRAVALARNNTRAT